MSLLDYLLKANLYLALFYACYWLLLRRHTFFTLNRIYLLTSVGLSLMLPLMELSARTVERLPVPVGVITLPVSVLATTQPTGPDWALIGWVSYGIVAFILLLRFAGRLRGVYAIIRHSERQPQEDFTLVLPQDERIPTFSFLRYLVLSLRDYAGGADREAVHPILAHELVHIRQRHSLDVLLMEVVQVLFWYNPVVMLYGRAIRQVHEFLADSVAADKQQYAAFLVEYALGAQLDTGPLANRFLNTPQLKERIRMMQRRATSRWAVSWYGLSGLIIFVTVMLVAACENESHETNNTPAGKTFMTVTGIAVDSLERPLSGVDVQIDGMERGTSTGPDGRYRIDKVPGDGRMTFRLPGYHEVKVSVAGQKDVPVMFRRPLNSAVESGEDVYTVVEHQPEFPGGTAALRNYLTENIHYPAAAQKTGVSGRVFIRFIVSETGEIKHSHILKGLGFGCDEEAARVVSQMPRWKPGRQNGKPVAVQYVLPVEFALEHSMGRADNIASEQVLPGALNRPLMVIDGKIIGRREDSSVNSSMNQLNPNDIDLVNVLKGESAKARYGDEGSEGVIEIYTKAYLQKYPERRPDTAPPAIKGKVDKN